MTRGYGVAELHLLEYTAKQSSKRFDHSEALDSNFLQRCESAKDLLNPLISAASLRSIYRKGRSSAALSMS
jgi:hypothetical protein